MNDNREDERFGKKGKKRVKLETRPFKKRFQYGRKGYTTLV